MLECVTGELGTLAESSPVNRRGTHHEGPPRETCLAQDAEARGRARHLPFARHRRGAFRGNSEAAQCDPAHIETLYGVLVLQF